MVDPTVRPGRPDVDPTALALLEREARAAVAEQERGGAQWLDEHPEVGARWDVRMAEADVLVAQIDDVVVGYIVAVQGDDRVVRVDQIWVTPGARELGFGDALLASAIDRGRRAGAVAVEGQALPGDRHTKNLYERAGIVARLITTYRKL